MQSALRERARSADRIAPIRIATVEDHVAALEHVDERTDQLIDRGAGRNIKEDFARRLQRSAQLRQIRQKLEARSGRFGWRAQRVAGNAIAALDRLPHEIGAHATEAEDREIAVAAGGHSSATGTLRA